MPESLKTSASKSRTAAAQRTTSAPKRKWTHLEVADQMFKDAFLIKKTRFSHLHPDLSDEELQKMTVEYFKKLNEETPR